MDIYLFLFSFICIWGGWEVLFWGGMGGSEPCVNRSKSCRGPSPAQPAASSLNSTCRNTTFCAHSPQQDAFRGAGVTAGRGGGDVDGRRSAFVHHHGQNLGRWRGEWRRSPRGGRAGAGPASRTPSISQRATQRRPPRGGWVQARWEGYSRE